MLPVIRIILPAQHMVMPEVLAVIAGHSIITYWHTTKAGIGVWPEDWMVTGIMQGSWIFLIQWFIIMVDVLPMVVLARAISLITTTRKDQLLLSILFLMPSWREPVTGRKAIIIQGISKQTRMGAMPVTGQITRVDGSIHYPADRC